MDGLQGTDSESGGSGAAEVAVSSKALRQRENQRAYRAKRRATASGSASGQPSSPEQREAQAVAIRRDEQANVVQEEEDGLKEGRGKLESDELPYVDAREYDHGNFVVLWWRKASIVYEMDLVEAKYIHRLIGQEIEVLEYHEKKSKGEV
jgi:hypothetical protein